MKKFLPYFFGAIMLCALGVLLVSSMKNKSRRMNERITLKAKDKIPYGFYAARQLLPTLFPQASVFDDTREPGYWDSLQVTGRQQLVIMPGIAIKADEYEVEEMLDFARKGNYVVLITKEPSSDLAAIFPASDLSSDDIFIEGQTDSLRLLLGAPRYRGDSTFLYPGKRFSAYFNKVDSMRTIVLGTNEEGMANFIQCKVGEGAVFLHTAPLAFSNYFILHKNNIRYYQQAMSVIPATVTKVVWNEYYLNKRTEKKEEEPNFLSVLLQQEAFRWALITAIATLALYVLSEMRRKQRVIPVMGKPRNESLDFVRTIGQLYYTQKDHANLAQKMSAHFLEHVRSRFKMQTTYLDDAFIRLLHEKSGYPENDLSTIVDFIHFVHTNPTTEEQLNQFFHQLEKFYQTS